MSLTAKYWNSIKKLLGFSDFVNLSTYLMEMSVVKSLLPDTCLSPNYIGEYSETCEEFFDKVLSKLVSYNIITPENNTPEYYKFVTTVVKENKPEFLNFSKTDWGLDKFMIKFVGASANARFS